MGFVGLIKESFKFGVNITKAALNISKLDFDSFDEIYKVENAPRIVKKSWFILYFCLKF